MIAYDGRAGKLVKAWPVLPYMALGVWLASVRILSSGAVWLSDNEVDGGNIRTLVIVATVASAIVFLVGAFGYPRLRERTPKRGLAAISGIVAGLGALIVVASGPFYLERLLSWEATEALFMLGGLLMGFGLGVIGLYCGRLYGGLSPGRVVMYVAFSECLIAVLFFTVIGSPVWKPVEGGPSLADMIFFVVLPVCAGLLAELSAFFPLSSVSCSEAAENELPKAFWKLLTVVFAFSFIVSSVYGVVVECGSVELILDGSKLVMLVQMVLALLLAGVAQVTEGDRLNFGKLYSVVMVTSVALVACLPIVSTFQTMLSQIVSLASVTFELFLWCILAFIVYQRNISSVVVFGFGYGLYLTGSAIGWLLGTQALRLLAESIGAPFTYMLMAGVVLVCAFVVFSEREFDLLFLPSSEDDPSLEFLLKKDLKEEATGEETHHGEKRFAVAIDKLSKRYQLSPRESDVLRYLVLGYSNDATAEKLSLALNTVRTYRQYIYAKTGAHTKQDIIRLLEEAMGK